MIVCGDDGLAHRLAAELRGVYGEQVTLVVPPSGRRVRQPVVGRARAASAALFDRVSAAVNRAGTSGAEPAVNEQVVEAAEVTEAVLTEVGADRAAALALVYDDDETNIRAALTARRLNPSLRLVLRLYNRRLGQHIEELLDQTAAVASGTGPGQGLDASTTVLSDADTAAPALAATALVGTSKVVQTEGLVLRAVERQPPRPGEVAHPGLCTLALLSTTSNDPAGADGSEGSGEHGPQLLPDEMAVASATGRGTVVLEQVAYSGPSLPAGRGGVPPFASLFSRRLRWSLAGLVGCVLALAVALMFVTGEHPLYATYVTLLDLFGINDPAFHESTGEQVLQLLSGLVGLLLLPVLLAAVLEALGTFRSASTLRKPPRGLGGHVVLLGLGKIGTRVLTRLRELHIPVVCVESDPEARGMATRSGGCGCRWCSGTSRQEGVPGARERSHRAHALLALTSADTTNPGGRHCTPGPVRPRSAGSCCGCTTTTSRRRCTGPLRAAHPFALTRSRSVSHLAAPAFAGAMMGRQILGAIPVERRVLLFAEVDVAGHPQLEGRTVGEAFRAGAWRVLALNTAPAGGRRVGEGDGAEEDSAPASGLVWDLPPTYVLGPDDRVVLAATRRGLAELLGRRRREPAGA
ncbi:TrkA-N domain-containing protein [Streptomyces viridochromogenes DSM 40736]|uniref:TrkA-N domain-containing protein n=1 Tax=Streptomyces viridochromogenes (strain DSM 40736 / JCM 4977 / BCRC 1201 / Tue 494) TaxID=591159 RepID=D9X3S7_STRVT|nr:TrkA-N domain-containing protein [Streptomyces viridochromogenes DSM 40736]